MPETRIVCSKCGKSEEFGAALASGWLYRQRAGEPEGYLVIRCPAHISEHARRLAGLPQQARTKRVADNIERGLWVLFGDGYMSSVHESDYVYDAELDAARYCISFSVPGLPPHMTRRYSTIDELIAAMREVEPNLRKWRLVEEE